MCSLARNLLVNNDLSLRTVIHRDFIVCQINEEAKEIPLLPLQLEETP